MVSENTKPSKESLEVYLIKKENLLTLVSKLADEFEIIAPVRTNGSVRFEKITDVNQIELGYIGHTKLPLKKFFEPPKEVLFTYTIKNDSVEIKDNLEQIAKEKRVILGAHACDIHSLEIMDKVFLGEYHDPYYATRRNNTIIIGEICNDTAEYCFCYYTKSGPNAQSGFDLLLTDVNDAYFVEVGSEKGKDLISRFSDLFEKAEVKYIDLKDEKVQKLIKKMREKGLPEMDKVYQDMVNAFSNEIWEELSKICLACGKCNYTCPTCYCFDINDEIDPEQTSGSRVRTWSSCHFLVFTRVTSGEVFRKDRSSRVKQRIYHKLVYSVNEIGEISCVGCGRCIDVCPAEIDLREIVKKIKGGA